jgi:hypothetical protein
MDCDQLSRANNCSGYRVSECEDETLFDLPANVFR